MKADLFVLFFNMLEGCACRVSEIIKLEKRDIDLEHRILTIRKAKTSKRLCKCSHYKKVNRRRIIVVDDKSCTKCSGERVIFKDQFTTVLARDIPTLAKYTENLSDCDKVFPRISRMTAWQYAKNAGIMAGLPIFEQQEERKVDGVWTHLFRKSRAKIMEDLGAKESLISRKLRHSAKNVTQVYTKVDLNAVLEWERKIYG